MHPRRKVLILLAINGVLMVAIASRFVALESAWEAWTMRQTAWKVLHPATEPDHRPAPK